MVKYRLRLCRSAIFRSMSASGSGDESANDKKLAENRHERDNATPTTRFIINGIYHYARLLGTEKKTEKNCLIKHRVCD